MFLFFYFLSLLILDKNHWIDLVNKLDHTQNELQFLSFYTAERKGSRFERATDFLFTCWKNWWNEQWKLILILVTKLLAPTPEASMLTKHWLVSCSYKYDWDFHFLCIYWRVGQFINVKTDEFANAKIVRSRDPAVLNPCDILVDVGAVYDPATHRYDHHQGNVQFSQNCYKSKILILCWLSINFQAGFTETLDANHTMKLSSAGLIYKHFGKKVSPFLRKQSEFAYSLYYQLTLI